MKTVEWLVRIMAIVLFLGIVCWFVIDFFRAIAFAVDFFANYY